MRRGRKAYENAVYIPIEGLINDVSAAMFFEGRIRYLINVCGYVEVVIYSINECSDKRCLQYYTDLYLSDMNIKKHLHFTASRPTQEAHNKRIIGYGDYCALHAIAPN